MLFDAISAILVQVFGLAYAWLNQNLVGPFLAFTRGFEFAVVFAAAILFFLISVFLVMRQAKKLPKSYFIEIVDTFGEKASIDGVRQLFSTHEAAESFARMYRDSYGRQYKFRVVGISQDISSKN